MRVQNHIPIKAVAIREEDGLEIGTEYDVEDIMMGQSNTSVELVGTKGTYNSISFKFMLNGREIDIFRSPLINPYMKFDGNWIDARWCDGMNRDGLPATWTYETEIPCERFDIWEDGEVYCVGLVFSIEDLK